MANPSPVPTTDPAQARRDLDEHGIAVVTEALSPDEVSDVRARLFDAVELSEADEVPTRGYPFDPDRHNIRVFHLFNLDPVFVDLIQRPEALEYVSYMLNDDFLISNFSANITEPGNGRMIMHADQGYVLPPWPEQALACNVAWLLDDLNDDNGGTRYVPGSHRFGHGPSEGELRDTVGIEAPAGSMLLLDGRLWHQTGENTTTDETRAALFGYYALRWLRPQINWNCALWPETVASLEPSFLHRLGFYTGNTEFQVPHGKRATRRMPVELDDGTSSFALASSERNVD
jgi:ectoine hydroxylase-related dioxygenase (phytanoyl-CoA dioxygenase family)